MNTLENFINGEHMISQSHVFAPIFNPTIGVQNQQVSLSTEEETNHAISIAEEFFATWQKVMPVAVSIACHLYSL